MSSNGDSGSGLVGGHAALIRMRLIGVGAMMALALGIAGCGASPSTEHPLQEKIAWFRSASQQERAEWIKGLSLQEKTEWIHRLGRILPTVSKGSTIERKLKSENAVIECDQREARLFSRSHSATETYEWERAREKHDPCNGGRPSPTAVTGR